MTEYEFNLLAPVEDDYSNVLCKACGKELTKRGVFNHIHSTTPEFLRTVRVDCEDGLQHDQEL